VSNKEEGRQTTKESSRGKYSRARLGCTECELHRKGGSYRSVPFIRMCSHGLGDMMDKEKRGKVERKEINPRQGTCTTRHLRTES
jgi:hypothetical protein